MSVLTTPGLDQAIENNHPVRGLAQIDHPDGIVRVHTGLGILNFDGFEWTGIWLFGRMRGVGASKRLTVREVVFEMRGIPPDLDDWLNTDMINVPAKAWLAGMDERGQRVIGEPYQIVDGLCNYQELVTDKGAVLLTISEPVFSIERAQNISFTPESLNDRHGPGLTGADKIAGLVDSQKPWTRT